MPFRLRFLQQSLLNASLSLVACLGTDYSRPRRRCPFGHWGSYSYQDAHPRCSEQVSRFSEHVDQFFSFQKPLAFCELLTVGALWQQHLGPEFAEKLVTAFHFLLLFSF
jgi:hypothetical protein